MAVIRDEGHKREMVLRLKRIEGQLRGIQAMIESGADCEKVAQQLSASRRALDKAFFNVVACAIRGELAPGQVSAGKRLEHAASLLTKFGFTPDHVVTIAKEQIAKHGG